MAPVVTMKQLLEAGVHFGHQTRRWNPAMRRFIHSERNGIYIVDLKQTLDHIDTSYKFVRDLVADGGTIMFVGTKKQAQDPVESYALRCRMPYINNRWLGGMLTNFETISKRVGKMRDYQRMKAAGDFESMPKKEALKYSRELEKLERNLLGMVNLTRLPEAIFVIDTNKEHIAVTEANKLGIPVVAVVDTNCDPDQVDFAIPGNDDAIRSANLMCRIIHDAVEEGRNLAAKRGGANPATNAMRTPEMEAAKAKEQEDARRLAQEEARARSARLAQAQAAPAAEAAPAAAPPEAAAPAAEAAAPAADAPETTDPGPAEAAPAPTETQE